jgi:hypothetical protein
MKEMQAVGSKEEAKESSPFKDTEESVRSSSQRQKMIELAVMVGTGMIAGMMLSFALCGSLVNLGGILGGGLTGLLINYLS